MIDTLPSEKYKPITHDVRFTNLIPQKIVVTDEGGQQGYFDAYSGVIVTRWGFNDSSYVAEENYYEFHIKFEEWEKIIKILEDSGYDYKIISRLPKDKEASNFLEDLARNFFGFLDLQ